MELSITILEDDPLFSAQLTELLKTWGAKHKIPLSTRCYFRGEDFLQAAAYEDDELFFLDIDLKTCSGITIAKQLRKDGFRGHIIFLTAFSEYVFDGYHVQALDYLLKPLDMERLDRCMRPVLRDREGSCYMFQAKSELIKIPYHKIMAFTSYRHYVDIFTQIPLPSDSKGACRVYRQKITLKALEQQLPKEFVRCHRTVIVNINKVMRLAGTELALSDHSVYPVSESYLKSVRDAFGEVLD